MPLGNLTSQFFANLYLNELDYYIKHNLKARYYVRYVDDFVVLSRNKRELVGYKTKLDSFLRINLSLSLHPQKSKIIPLKKGITFLGLRVFYHCKLLKKSNRNRINKRLKKFLTGAISERTTKEEALASFEGWEGYAKMAHTYKFRMRLKEEYLKLFK